MSRMIRLLLTLLCAAALISPATTSADTPTPPLAHFAPGGLARAPVASLNARSATTEVPGGANSVDGWSRTVFQSYRDGSWDVFSMRPNGAELRKLTAEPGSDGRPKQCRDNGRIVFVSNRTGNYEIFTMAPDGTDVRQVTFNPAEDNYPAWSPDCRRIAFASVTGDDNWDIYITDPDGAKKTELVGSPDIEFSPAWSPDGQWIAWIVLSNSPQPARVWASRLNGSETRAVSSNLYFAENLVWSPDSKRIAFDKISRWGQNFTDIAYVEVPGSEWSWPDTFYTPDANYTDALMGGWSPDGREVLMTLVKYTVVDNELLMESASLARASVYGGYEPTSTPLPGSGLDMLGDWQRTDSIAPVSRALVPALAGSDYGAFVEWTGWDPGGSGITSYELEIRRSDNTWIPWYYLSYPNGDFVYGQPGERVYARVRTRDAAGNVEPWPSSPDGDGSILFYKDRYYGHVFDVRQAPVPGATIDGPSHPVTPFTSKADGSYDAYSFEDINALRASHPGYGAWEPLPATFGESMTKANFALPPKTNAVVNGGFETGLEGWTSVSGEVGPEPYWIRARSGEGCLSLTARDPNSTLAAAAQAVVVPPASAHPTLSFFAQPYPGSDLPLNRIRATATEANGAATTLTLHTLDDSAWAHFWADLSPWGGKPITLTLEVKLQWIDTTGTVLFDEVSVGEWHTPSIISVEGPQERPGLMTVRGDNFEPGAVIRIRDLDLATTFVDSQTLTAEVTESISVGTQPLWVTNPGGEQALTLVRVGRSTLLPVIAFDRQ